MTELAAPMSVKSDMSARTPKDRIIALINLTNELSALMAEETALLKDKRPSAIAPLQERKAKLAGAYAVAIRDMAADRSDLSTAGESLLQDLREMTKRFEQQAAEQRAMLSGAAQVVEGVMRSVAAETRPQSPSYGQNGASERPAPIAVNINS